MAYDTNKLAPFFIFLAVGSTVATLYQFGKDPRVALALFVGSVIALAIRFYQLSGRGGRGGAVDYVKLRKTRVLPYSAWLRENVRGHDAIIQDILVHLESNLNLAHPNRTLGAYFLVGPTGTGKTFLAQLLGQALFPQSEPIILRMNQYKHTDDVFTLLGPPPGRPGHEVGGALTRPVLENPYRVVIFDEIEKAHRDLQHSLYDIIDTASCREKSSGKLVSFSGCVFFATCNAGVEELRTFARRAGGPAQWLGGSRDALIRATHFEKSFLARWDQIFFMDELSPIHVAEVACLNIAKHWQQYGIEVSYTSPRLLLETVKNNAEFREYGVRQLAAYVRMKSDNAIRHAQAKGLTKLHLDISPRGEIRVMAGAPQQHVKKVS